MSKKEAVLVTFSLMTRVVVKEGEDEEAMYVKAVEKLLGEPGLIREKLLNGGEEIEKDEECPYGSLTEDNIPAPVGEDGPNECVVCGSEDISADLFDTEEGGCVNRGVRCNNPECEATWTETYKYHDYEKDER